jgi:hypothetical protein
VVLALDFAMVLLHWSSWGYGVPVAFPLMLATILPLAIMIAAKSGGAFKVTLVEGPGGRAPMMMPVLGCTSVAGWALMNHRPVGGASPWIAAVVGGALLAFAVRKVQPGAWGPTFVGGYLPGFAAWSVGLLLALNGVLDTAPAERHRAAIVERAEPRWGGHVLELAPWGPFHEPLRLRVDRELHNGAVTGGTALVTLHRGALGIPWYRVEKVSGP